MLTSAKLTALKKSRLGASNSDVSLHDRFHVVTYVTYLEDYKAYSNSKQEEGSAKHTTHFR